MKKYLISLILPLFLMTASHAQNGNQFQTATPGQSVIGVVAMCLNSLGIAVPTNQSNNCPGGGGGSSGAVFGPTAVGSAAANPPVLIGGTIDGTATGLVSVLKVLGGTAFINCANCSGSGISVAFGSAIGSVGTPGGFKDGSGNFQPLLGDVANGQWVNIKSSVALGVTGTFFQATQPISAASLPLPTNAATQTTLASILTALGTPFQAGGSIGNTSFGISGTLPAFAATPTFNLGTLNGAATAALQPTNAALGSTTSGQTGNIALGAVTTAAPTYTTAQSNALSLTTSGALRIDGSGATQPVSNAGTFAVQATLQASSATAIGTVNPTTIGNWGLQVSTQNSATPTNMVLMGGQFNTSPTAITSGNVSPFQLDANGNLLVNIKVGGGTGGTSSTFGSAFPTTGTPIGFTQGGNFVAASGTSGNLNVQCANCSGSGASAVDEATMTFGTSVFAPMGGVFQTTATSNPLTTGQQGMAQLTINRALHTNLRNSIGVEVGVAATPLQVSLANTAANATALLVTGTGGTFPVTQATASSLNATVVGTGTFAVQAAQSGTWNVTNISGTVSLPTGAATSALQPTNAAAASTTSGQTGIMNLAAVTTAAPTYTTATSNFLSLNTSGGLRVDGSGVTQPVSIAAAVTVSQATAASLNATVVNAGTFAVQATLQASSATAIGTVNPTTIGSWGLQVATQNSATPTNGGLVLGQFNTSPTAITSGNVSPFQLDANGNLKVNIITGASSGAVAQGSTTSGQTGGLMQAAALTSAPTYTTATTNPLTMDLSGALRVNVTTALGLAAGSTTSGQTGSLIMGAVTTAAPAYTTAQTNYVSLTTAGALRGDIASVGSTALSNFGSAPGAVPAVPVNSNTQPTENHIGEAGSNQIEISTAPTVTASAYTAGNAVGGLQTLANAARVSGTNGASGTGGIIQKMVMTAKTVQSTQFDIFFFNANPSGSTCTDHSAFVLAAADAAKVIGILTIPSTAANGGGWFSGGTGSAGLASYYPIGFSLGSATSVFSCAVARGTPTFGSTSDVAFNYNVLRD